MMQVLTGSPLVVSDSRMGQGVRVGDEMGTGIGQI